MTEISILCPDRTGSTYICSLFDNVKNVWTSKNFILYEIFKKNREISPSKKRKIISKIKKQHPDKNYYLYKMMYNQTNVEDLKNFLLPDDQMIKIILTRNVLDMYISHRKAKELRQWKNTNTSHHKVKFDLRGFEKWRTKRTNYLIGLNELINRKGYRAIVIDYDEIHQYQTDHQKLEYMLKRIDDELGFKLTPKKNIKIELKKQDRSKSYQDKVSNYKEMMKYLKDKDLELNKIFE